MHFILALKFSERAVSGEGKKKVLRKDLRRENWKIVVFHPRQAEQVPPSTLRW